MLNNAAPTNLYVAEAPPKGGPRQPGSKNPWGNAPSGGSAPAMPPKEAHKSPPPRATTTAPQGRRQWGPVGNEGEEAMCPVWGAVPTTNVLDLLTYVKFESHNQIKFTKMSATIRRLAEEMGIGFEQGPSSSYKLNSVFLKKRQQLSLTLISGPHVHKKSRDQYKIDHYSGFFI